MTFFKTSQRSVTSRFAAASFFFLALAGCNKTAQPPTNSTPNDASTSNASASNTPASSTRKSVVATTTQLEDIVGIIADGKVQVIGLVPRNGDPHEFEPTPDNARQIADSQAVFKNGVGLETWLDKLIENAGGQRLIFDTSRGVSLGVINRAFAEGGERDPHIWMSPVNMTKVVDNIVAGLKQVDPSDATTFAMRGADYKKQLVQLDLWAAKRLSVVPVSHRKLVTAHDAMGYFAKRYNFQIVGAVIPSVSTEASETSAKQLAALIQKIQSAKVPAVFAEASNNPKFIEQIGQEARIRVVTDLYVDSLGAKNSDAGTYIGFFRHDVNRIADALK